MQNFFKLLFLTLTACSPWQKGYFVEEVPHRQEWQSQAQTVSVQTFFESRMLNRLRKAQVGNWLILYEDAEYVYFGYPRFAGLFDDRRLVENLMRVSLSDLNNRFPGWKNIDGIWVREQLLAKFTGQSIAQWQAVLQADRISIQGQGETGQPLALDLDLRTGKPLSPPEPISDK